VSPGPALAAARWTSKRPSLVGRLPNQMGEHHADRIGRSLSLGRPPAVTAQTPLPCKAGELPGRTQGRVCPAGEPLVARIGADIVAPAYRLQQCVVVDDTGALLRPADTIVAKGDLVPRRLGAGHGLPGPAKCGFPLRGSSRRSAAGQPLWLGAWSAFSGHWSVWLERAGSDFFRGPVRPVDERAVVAQAHLEGEPRSAS
jgi:hypothetical protein